MNTANPRQAQIRAGLLLELRQIHRRGIAQGYLHDLALAVQVYRYFPVRIFGDGEHFLVELPRGNLPDGHPHIIEGLEFFQNIRFDIG